VREVQGLEPAGETFEESVLDQERRGAEQDHLQPSAGARVFVPQALHRLAPTGELLHLVENNHRAPAAGVLRGQASGLPLLLDAGSPAQGRLVSAGEARGEARGLGHLLDESRLADLSGADHRHEEAAWFPEATGEDGGLGS
jgi:hypothetical protein